MIVMQRKLRAGFKPKVELLDVSLQLPACLPDLPDVPRRSASTQRGEKKQKRTRRSSSSSSMQKGGNGYTQINRHAALVLRLSTCQ